MTLNNPDTARTERFEIASSSKPITIDTLTNLETQIAELQKKLHDEQKLRLVAENQSKRNETELSAMKRKWERDVEIYTTMKKQIDAYSKPPQLAGYDIAAKTVPFFQFGGDVHSFVDFKNQFHLDRRMVKAEERTLRGIGRPDVVSKLEELKHKAGIILIDVEGHDNADMGFAYATLVALRAEIKDELRTYGDVTTKPFNYLHDIYAFMRQKGQSKRKTISINYTEVHENGTVRHINAGMPWYMILRGDNGKLELVPDTVKPAFAMGTRPSKENIDLIGKQEIGVEEYQIREEQLKRGDTLVLLSDGYTDCGIEGSKNRNRHRFEILNDLEIVLNQTNGLSSKERCELTYQKIITKYHPRRDDQEGDDMTIALIKRK